MAQGSISEEEKIAIEQFDHYYMRSLETYGACEEKLQKFFPNIHDFLHPTQSKGTANLSIETNFTLQFNEQLRHFEEMLRKSEYLQAKLGLKVDDKVSDILPEYYYEIEKGEVIPSSQIVNIFVDKTCGSRLVTFTSFALALQDRHYQLIKQGRIPKGTPFGKNFEAECKNEDRER